MAALDKIVEAMARYTVVLEPDRNLPEWWAGAPSVVRAPDGTFYLAARMRHDESPKGRRGYEIRILESADGKSFQPIHHITREAAGVPGFERPALVIDPVTGQFKLYACAGLERGWTILKFDDARHPAEFKPESVRPILAPEYPDDDCIHVTGYKDPVVFHDGTGWHMFVIGIDRVERIHHFRSGDGEAWTPGQPVPIIENAGWHHCYTRPACVLPMPVGYLFVYEGSSLDWADPNYNIATGLAYAPNLVTYIDLTPRAPLFKSTTPGPFHTWRYSHWMYAGDQVFVYFEAARPNGSNEIRMAAFPTGCLTA
jgi:hypothetical protein